MGNRVQIDRARAALAAYQASDSGLSGYAFEDAEHLLTDLMHLLHDEAGGPGPVNKVKIAALSAIRLFEDEIAQVEEV